MPGQTLLAQLCHRSSTAAQWTAANPVLGLGERGFESDTNRYKTGDEVRPWNQLPYEDAALLTALANKTNNATTAALSARVVTLEAKVAQHEALLNGLGFSASEHEYNPEHPAFQGLTALADAVRWLLGNQTLPVSTADLYTEAYRDSY